MADQIVTITVLVHDVDDWGDATVVLKNTVDSYPNLEVLAFYSEEKND